MRGIETRREKSREEDLHRRNEENKGNEKIR